MRPISRIWLTCRRESVAVAPSGHKSGKMTPPSASSGNSPLRHTNATPNPRLREDAAGLSASPPPSYLGNGILRAETSELFGPLEARKLTKSRALRSDYRQPAIVLFGKRNSARRDFPGYAGRSKRANS
jgi:hypothetical protein